MRERDKRFQSTDSDRFASLASTLARLRDDENLPTRHIVELRIAPCDGTRRLVTFSAMSNAPTMHDIAAAAGVHSSTVSLCLSGNTRIPIGTRDRVRKIAREMGYTPNPYLSALMQNRRKGRLPSDPPVIAFVTFFPTENGWRERFPGLVKTQAAATQQARARGYRLETFWAPLDQITPQRIGQILYTRRVAGAMLSPFPRPIESYDWPWDHFAAVAIGPSLRDPRVHRVRNDHFQSVEIVFEQARALGYQRVGMAIRKDIHERMNYRWFAGFQAKHHVSQVRDMPDPALMSDFGRDEFLAWIKRNQLDAVIVTRAEEPLRWMRGAGLSVPGKIGLVSLASEIGGKVSGIYDNWEMQGVRAVNMIIDLLVTNDLGLHDFPNLSLVRGIWNPGKTLGTSKRASSRSHPPISPPTTLPDLPNQPVVKRAGGKRRSPGSPRVG